MSARIVIIQGHPDPDAARFGRALAGAYAEGAAQAGRVVRVIDVTALDFPVLRSREEWEGAAPTEDIRRAQADIAWAGHLSIFYPLWLGSMPALLKAFLEQAFRPGFAVASAAQDRQWTRLLAGRSARIVVTMGMPALVYRWYFRAHSLKSLERNILGFCGIAPIRECVIGMVEAGDGARREKWLRRMRALGKEGR